MWLALWLWSAAAADEAEPADVVQVVRDGVVVNWTRMTVMASSAARGSGVEASRQVVEHQARQQLGPGILAGALTVQVTPEQTVGDLRGDPELGSALSNRITRWFASETVYYASGRIAVTAELSIDELLKPWKLSQAATAPVDAPQPSYTGLLIDARGTGATPAFAPRLRAADGAVLYEGRAWKGLASDVVPVIWVSDPAHPAATRVGEQPLMLRAIEASGADLTLDPDDVIRFRTGLQGALLLGEGRVVVVVGP